MQKQTFIIQLFFLLLATVAVLGCGTTVTASNTEEKSPALKNQSTPSRGAGVSMRVLWTISKYIIGPNAQWGEDDARKLLFKPLDIDANSITFDGKTCRDVTFKKETAKTKEYLEKFFDTTPQELDIRDEEVEVVKTSCDLPGFGEYLRFRGGRLMIRLNGVFFFLKPAVNY